MPRHFLHASATRLGVWGGTCFSASDDLFGHLTFCHAEYLFQSDHAMDDLEVIEDAFSLYYRGPNDDLQAEQAGTKYVDASAGPHEDDTWDDLQCGGSLQYPEDVSLVREALDDAGLQHLIQAFTDPVGRIYVTALAMQNGARIPTSLKRKVTEALKKADELEEMGIFKPSQRQMWKALKGYPNDGTPWNFGGMGMLVRMQADGFINKKPEGKDAKADADLLAAQKAVKEEMEGTATPGEPDPDTDKTILPGE